MPTSATNSTWRKIFDEHFSHLAEQLEQELNQQVEARVAARISTEVDGAVKHAVSNAVAETQKSARRRLAEEINQAVRRMRQCNDTEEAGALLAEIAAPYCEQAIVFFLGADTARAESGWNGEPGRRVVEFPISHAAAFLSARETGDPVVAMSTPAEVSAEVIEVFGHAPDERVYLFPLVVRGEVRSILYATGEAQVPALELMADVAALQMETKVAGPLQSLAHDAARDLVSIDTAPFASIGASPEEPATSTARSAGWWDLSREEQQVHLAAQRSARVKVAELSLYRADAVSAGRMARNLYAALKEPIDAAREEFRNKFTAACPSMVDYLHLELIRSLAHEDAELLGPDYAGPIV
jgi:hypothetical protein